MSAMPEELAPICAAVAGVARSQRRPDGVVHAEELVVLAEHLREPGLVLGEQGEARDKIEKARFLACPAQQDLERDAPLFVFALE